MTQALSIVGAMNNGVSSQLLANLNTSRSMASDLAGSVFNSTIPVSTIASPCLNGPGMGMGMCMGMGMGMYPGMGMYGMGMYNPLMMNEMYQQIMASNSTFQHKAMDRQSDWNVEHAWKNDVNQTQIAAKDEEFRNKIQQMKQFIEANNPDAANNMYHTLLNMAAKKYNPEMNGNRRLDAKNAMKSVINQMYEQYTGSSIIDDIDAHCAGSTENAWEDGLKLRWANGHRLSRDTFKAIVTDQDKNTVLGESIVKKGANYAVKGLGSAAVVAAPLLGAWGGKALGAKIVTSAGKSFGPIGALVGLAAGIGISLIATSNRNKAKQAM